MPPAAVGLTKDGPSTSGGLVTFDEFLALAKETRPDIPWEASVIGGTSYVSLLITQDSPFGPTPVMVALLSIYPGDTIGGVFASCHLKRADRPTMTLNWRGSQLVWPFVTLPRCSTTDARGAILDLTDFTDRFARKLAQAEA